MIRLALDTSFEHLSICITKNNKPLVNYFSLCNRTNTKIIFQVIDDLTKNAEIELDEVDIYVINCGPGSYTGVRIGMAVIKTFAQVYKKPIIPINSLELIASQIINHKKEFPVLLNCTRREIFFSKFKIYEEYPVAKTPISMTNLEKFIETSNNIPVVLYRISPEKRRPEPMFELLKKLKLDFPVPDAMLLDRLGAKKLLKSSFDYNKPVNPIYIKREV